MIASGEGKWEDFETHYKEDAAVLVYWRCEMGDNVSKRSKFVLLKWCGPKMKTVQRVTSMTTGKDVEKYLGYLHVVLEGTNPVDFNHD